MFASTLLDVFIGLIVVYLLVSLLASALAELIEAVLKFRAGNLHAAINELLDSQDAAVRRLYEHELISSLFIGDYGSEVARKTVTSAAPKDAGPGKQSTTTTTTSTMKPKTSSDLPSYIPASNFSLALMDLIVNDESVTPASRKAITAGSLRTALQAEPSALSANTRVALLSMLDAANNELDTFRAAVEKWFNGVMDRAAGWYKRRTGTLLFAIGFVFAIALNIDTIRIAQRLSVDTALRESLLSGARHLIANPPAGVTPSGSGAGNGSGGNPPATSMTSSSSSAAPATVSNPQPAGAKTSASAGTPPNAEGSVSTATGAPPATSTPTSSPDDLNTLKTAAAKFNNALGDLENASLPIGWSTADPLDWNFLLLFHILGWILTGVAVSLGAPFWFDMLNKFVVVRSTVKPAEKSPSEKSKS